MGKRGRARARASKPAWRDPAWIVAVTGLLAALSTIAFTGIKVRSGSADAAVPADPGGVSADPVSDFELSSLAAPDQIVATGHARSDVRAVWLLVTPPLADSPRYSAAATLHTDGSFRAVITVLDLPEQLRLQRSVRFAADLVRSGPSTTADGPLPTSRESPPSTSEASTTSLPGVSTTTRTAPPTSTRPGSTTPTGRASTSTSQSTTTSRNDPTTTRRQPTTTSVAGSADCFTASGDPTCFDFVSKPVS